MSGPETRLDAGLSLGTRLPLATPHANSVHLPTINEVNQLMEGDPAITQQINGGYGRFTADPFNKQVLAVNRERFAGRGVLTVCSKRAAEDLVEHFEPREPQIEEDATITVLHYKIPSAGFEDEAALFSKYSGNTVSTRRAQDYLYLHDMLDHRHSETTNTQASYASVADSIASQYPDADLDVVLTNTGMGAVYGAVEALRKIGLDAEEPRKQWIQFGWTYSDTKRITDMCFSDEKNAVKDISTFTELEAFLKTEGATIAGLLAEAPTNPIITTPNLERLRELTAKYDIPLVVDVSVAGSRVIDVSPYADVIIESLTKFASGHGDLMMGCVLINQAADASDAITAACKATTDAPYIAELQRFAFEFADYRTRAQKTGANTLQLVDFLSQRSEIQQLHWSGKGRSGINFGRLARDTDMPCGIIGLQLGNRYQSVYDNLPLPKGPSFGANFTMATPYREIAHPIGSIGGIGDLESRLKKAGVTDNLRISVGTEDPEQIVEVLKSALDRAA